MARINNIGNNLLDQLLPQYGNARINTPIWNESQQMFITDQYVSAGGHTYYKGVRVSDRFVTILHIGLYHNWTYINEVETYAFNGRERTLIGKTRLDVFYNEDLVRQTTEKLVRDYLESQMKMSGKSMESQILDKEVKAIVDASLLSINNQSSQTMQRLESVKPLLLPNE